MKFDQSALMFVASLVAVWFAWKTFFTEKFQPEFLDKKSVEVTVANENSSYRQTTNHIDPAPFDMEPVKGKETIFQVNQFKSYMT